VQLLDPGEGSRDELRAGPDGAVLANPPIVALAELADELGETKLIAEAWDAGGLYQVGSFPAAAGRSGTAATATTYAGSCAAMPGSSAPSPRARRKLRPLPVVAPPSPGKRQLVTCHDGFTLRDLVSYDAKHNDANARATVTARMTT